jgi:hypothetical protein
MLGAAMSIALILGLMPVIPAFAAGTFNSPNPSSGPPGTVVYLSGTGFPTGTVTIYFNTTQTLSGASSFSGGSTTTGDFSNAYFVVPTIYSRGNYVVWVNVGGETSPAKQFTVTPGMVLSTSSASVGDQITITGSGYTSSGTVTIYLDSVSQQTTTANIYGGFSVTFTIPRMTKGNHTFSTYDTGSGITTSAPFNLVSKLSVNPTSSAFGTPVTLTGTGFTASSAITVYLDNVNTTSTTSDTYGGFTISNYTLPATTSGTHTLRAQDNTGNYVTTTITTISGILIDPSTGPTGTQVNISGNGFRSSEAISIFIDNTNLNVSGLTTNSAGAFSTSITMPVVSFGSHQLKAVDSVNNAVVNFAVTANAVISPTSGYAGTKITLNGTGFIANQVATISFDNSPVGTATINSQGSFSMSFDAPSRQAGAYKVRATDGTNIVENNFNVTTSVKFVTKNSATAPGYVGEPVTVSGVGFKAGATITITYDGKEVKTGTVGSDTNFSITFNAPASKAGEHTVTISDGTVMLPLKYYMDTTAPASPTMVKPETGERQKATGKFTWNSVSDPSGITYELQIASDVSFSASSMILEKKGLTATEYTLTKAEKLKNTKKDAPDFWRVRAVDSAENAGNWSNIWSFTVGGVLPAWALWVLIGLGAVIILLFAFWLGRRSSGGRRISTRIIDNG